MNHRSFYSQSKTSNHYCRILCYDWCPRAESNHDLMITNQLHDLHATGADLTVAARIIAEADGNSILADDSWSPTNSQLLAHAT